MNDRIQTVLSSIAASAKPGSCQAECDTLGGRLFVETGGVNGGVRADFYQVGAKHYHLRIGHGLLDPTVYQFFNVPGGFQGKVLFAPKDRFIEALRELHAKYGYSRLVDSAIKSAEEFYEACWGKATLYKSGATLFAHVGKATGRVRGYYR